MTQGDGLCIVLLLLALAFALFVEIAWLGRRIEKLESERRTTGKEAANGTE